MLNFVKSPIHKGLCFALAFIFIFLLLLLPVSAEGYSDIYPDTIGWKDGDSLTTLVLAILDSLGISFSSSSDTPSEDIYSFAQSQIEEFIEYENSNWEEFWRQAQVGVDKLGNLLLNHTTAGKIYQFANWLIGKYNLENNSSVDTTASSVATYSLNGYPCFPVPTIFNSSGLSAGISFSNSSAPTYFFCVFIDAQHTTFGMFPFSKAPFSYSYTLNWGESSSTRQASALAGNFYYSQFQYITLSLRNYSHPSEELILPYSSLSQLNSILSLGGDVVSNSPAPYQIVINTTTVNIPTLEPDEGISLTIPGSEWGMTVSQILDLIAGLIRLYDNTQLEIIAIVDTLENIISNLQTEVSVNNIPGGVVLDYDNYDVPLDAEWGIVDEFFLQGVQDDDTLFTPLDTLKSIIFGLPEPFIAFFSVIVIFTVAYGFIRMGRDSH